MHTLFTSVLYLFHGCESLHAHIHFKGEGESPHAGADLCPMQMYKRASKMQIAVVALNRPLKAAYAAWRMAHLTNEFRTQRQQGRDVKEVYFSDAVSDCAMHALSWLENAYCGLEKVDMKSSLTTVG
jgi:hypothetical protein